MLRFVHQKTRATGCNVSDGTTAFVPCNEKLTRRKVRGPSRGVGCGVGVWRIIP